MNLKKIIGKTRHGLASFILTTLSVAIVWIATIFFLPTTHWFQYISVQPAENPQIGIIKMISYVNVNYEDMPTEWVDSLYCQYKNDYAFISSNVSNGTLRGTNVPKPWAYGGELPKTESTCYISSVITIETSMGFKKSQTITSHIFEYKP